MTIRVIPMLSLVNEGLYRTISFKKPRYIGDPLNAIKIFNDKEVNELVIMDINPKEGLSPERVSYLEILATRAFMPVAYGGHIESMEQARIILKSGFEKVILNSAFFSNPGLISGLSKHFGNQAIVISIDVKKNLFGKKSIYSQFGKKKEQITLKEAINKAVDLGAGEIYIRSIDNDGKMEGYDLDILKEVCDLSPLPVVAIGGAGNTSHFREAITTGAHAVAGGSIFVYKGPRRGILINYPSKEELMSLETLAKATYDNQ